METVSGRGINCENGVYFDFVDDAVVMTIYKDMPGTPPDRIQPNVIKSFPVSNWESINRYLMGTHDKINGVLSDDMDEDEFEGEGVVGKISEDDRIKSTPELPKVASIPSVLSITKSEDKEEKENGKATSDKEAPEA